MKTLASNQTATGHTPVGTALPLTGDFQCDFHANGYKSLPPRQFSPKYLYFGSSFFPIHVFPGILPPRNASSLKMGSRTFPFFPYLRGQRQKGEHFSHDPGIFQKDLPFSRYLWRSRHFASMNGVIHGDDDPGPGLEPRNIQIYFFNPPFFLKSPERKKNFSLDLDLFRDIGFFLSFFSTSTWRRKLGGTKKEYLWRCPKKPSSFRDSSRTIPKKVSLLPIFPSSRF